MTTYELAVLSSFGETHQIIVQSEDLDDRDTVKNAIEYAYYPISGDCWYGIKNGLERPCVRARWIRKAKDGREIKYVKDYTCNRLRAFKDLQHTTATAVTIDDLNNILLGMRFAFIVNDPTRLPRYIPRLYDSSSAIKEYYGQLPDKRAIDYSWIHEWDEKEHRRRFLSNFEPRGWKI
jgi:hypothetical protein